MKQQLVDFLTVANGQYAHMSLTSGPLSDGQVTLVFGQSRYTDLDSVIVWRGGKRVGPMSFSDAAEAFIATIQSA